MGDDISDGQTTFNCALRLLRKKGKIVSYGHPMRRVFDPFVFQNQSATLLSPVNDMPHIRSIIRQGAQLVDSGEIKLRPLISKVISLSEVGKGLKLVTDYPEQHLKIIVDIQ